MRILVVTSEWPSAEHPASGVFVASQVETLRGLGIEVEVFAFRGSGDPRRYVRARRAVAQLLADERFDAVHAHFGQSGLVVPSGLPLIVSFYGSDVFGIVSASGRYTVGGWILARSSRIVARRASEVVAISKAVAKRLPARRMHIVPLGVDRQTFRPMDKLEARRTLGLVAEGRLVLFNGDPRATAKRYALAREVMDRLTSDAELITVSDQPRSVVNLYMNACDAFLVTSRHEGGPVAVREALAAGLPVVSVDVGDVAEWIDDVDGCEVCTGDDPASIAVALDRVLREPRRITPPALDASDELSVARRIADIYRSITETATV
jgi:teichuronic acid biosynthesis glycosyltransferase TuaC